VVDAKVMKGLFGQPVSDGPRKRKGLPNGYASVPGTGPIGETCGTCKHIARVEKSRIYIKCDLARKYWTNSYGTDIRVRSAACQLWEPKQEV
jgi:hypothetical protein